MHFMNPISYERAEVQNENGQSWLGRADLWEGSREPLSPVTFFPLVWSKLGKEIVQSATKLKLPDGREFVLADPKKREVENGPGYFSFLYCSTD